MTHFRISYITFKSIAYWVLLHVYCTCSGKKNLQMNYFQDFTYDWLKVKAV